MSAILPDAAPAMCCQSPGANCPSARGCTAHDVAASIEQKGFALPAAIFLMVILAALGAFMVSINTMQTSSSSLDVLGVNAYQAARAGVEWGAYQVLQQSKPPNPCFADTSFSFPGTSLAAFTVTVRCNANSARTTTTEAGITINVDLITANACNAPTGVDCPNTGSRPANYVEREVQITVAQ